MSHDISPPSNIKVTRMCNFDEFISSVDRRIKHSSGLAIQLNVINTIIPDIEPNSLFKSENISYHSSFYKKAVKERKERRENSNQEILKQNEKKQKVESFLKSQLENYKAEKRHGRFSISDCDTITIDPSPKEMAQFRHIQMFGPFPKQLFSDII